MALLTLFLLALSKERWLWAMSLALLLGLTRPIAVPIAAVTVVALWCRWRVTVRAAAGPHRDRGGLAALAGCVVSGLLWPAIAGAVTGQAQRVHGDDVDLAGEPRDRPVQAVAGHVAVLLRPDLGPGLADRPLRRHRRHGARAVGHAPRTPAANVVPGLPRIPAGGPRPVHLDLPLPHPAVPVGRRSDRRCRLPADGAPGDAGSGSGSACCSSRSWSASGTGSTSSGGSSRRPTTRRDAGRPTGSAALEDRLLLGQERVDGGPVVRARPGERHQLRLVGECGLEVLAGARCAPPGGSTRRPGSGRPRGSGPARSTVCSNWSAGTTRVTSPRPRHSSLAMVRGEHEQLLGLGRADQAGQPPRRPGVARQRDRRRTRG